MRRSSIHKFMAVLAFLISVPAVACNTTLSSGGNIANAVQSNAGGVVCLNPGTYNLGSTSLNMPNGTTLKGLGSNRDAVVVNSTANRAIIAGNNVAFQNFLLSGPGGSYAEFGILTASNTGVQIWGLRIQNFKINIGINGSSGVDVLDTFMRYNGIYGNGIAEPNMWINNASDIYVYYGEALGSNENGNGDGEISSYGSSQVDIYGTHVTNSGASAIYLVNCDYCSVSNTQINSPGEWGIDVVQGSDYFLAYGNYVANARYGGAVFDEAGSLGGEFSTNAFVYNRTGGLGACNGINVIGSVSGVVQSGNSSTPSGIICTFNP